MTLSEKIQCMEAFERGEEIECVSCGYDVWGDAKTPLWDWSRYDYRIKPKQKQTVTIEKWLCKSRSEQGYFVVETSQGYDTASLKVKLLDTYEVEI